MDADGSFDPAQLPRVADPVRAGSRPARARPAPPDQPAAPGRRTPGSPTRALAWRLRRTTGVAVHDLGPMRAARRADLLALDLRDRRFGYPLEMVVAAAAPAGRSPRSTSTTRRARPAPGPR